jgi:hypothetical protein
MTSSARLLLTEKKNVAGFYCIGEVIEYLRSQVY